MTSIEFSTGVLKTTAPLPEEGAVPSTVSKRLASMSVDTVGTISETVNVDTVNETRVGALRTWMNDSNLETGDIARRLVTRRKKTGQLGPGDDDELVLLTTIEELNECLVGTQPMSIELYTEIRDGQEERTPASMTTIPEREFSGDPHAMETGNRTTSTNIPGAPTQRKVRETHREERADGEDIRLIRGKRIKSELHARGVTGYSFAKQQFPHDEKRAAALTARLGSYCKGTTLANDEACRELARYFGVPVKTLAVRDLTDEEHAHFARSHGRRRKQQPQATSQRSGVSPFVERQSPAPQRPPDNVVRILLDLNRERLLSLVDGSTECKMAEDEKGRHLLLRIPLSDGALRQLFAL